MLFYTHPEVIFPFFARYFCVVGGGVPLLKKQEMIDIWRAENLLYDQTPELIRLKKMTDARGNLSVVEQCSDVPFEIQRIFYLYDVPTGESRGAHAHVALHQFLVCLSGSFDVVWDNGTSSEVVHLNRPWMGLHIPPMIWASECNFDSGSVCLVVTSALYDEHDYIRDYERFRRARKIFNAEVREESAPQSVNQ